MFVYIGRRNKAMFNLTGISVNRIAMIVALVVISVASYAQTEAKFLLFGAVPYTVTEKFLKSEYEKSMSENLGAGNYIDSLAENETFPDAMQRLQKSVPLPKAKIFALFVSGVKISDEINQDKLEKMISDGLVKIRSAGVDLHSVVIVPASKDITAREMGAFYMASDQFGCGVLGINMTLSDKYYDEVFKELARYKLPEPVTSESVKTLTAPPSPAKETTSSVAAVDKSKVVAVSTTNTMVLQMDNPISFQAFDSPGKVGITRKTLKKHPSVAR